LKVRLPPLARCLLAHVTLPLPALGDLLVRFCAAAFKVFDIDLTPFNSALERDEV